MVLVAVVAGNNQSNNGNDNCNYGSSAEAGLSRSGSLSLVLSHSDGAGGLSAVVEINGGGSGDVAFNKGHNVDIATHSTILVVFSDVGGWVSVGFSFSHRQIKDLSTSEFVGGVWILDAWLGVCVVEGHFSAVDCHAISIVVDGCFVWFVSRNYGLSFDNIVLGVSNNGHSSGISGSCLLEDTGNTILDNSPCVNSISNHVNPWTSENAAIVVEGLVHNTLTSSGSVLSHISFNDERAVQVVVHIVIENIWAVIGGGSQDVPNGDVSEEGIVDEYKSLIQTSVRHGPLEFLLAAEGWGLIDELSSFRAVVVCNDFSGSKRVRLIDNGGGHRSLKIIILSWDGQGSVFSRGRVRSVYCETHLVASEEGISGTESQGKSGAQGHSC